MKLKYQSLTVIIAIVLLSVSVSLGQQDKAKTENKTSGTTTKPVPKVVNITQQTKPEELAQIAFDVLGGEKFKNVKSLVLIGTLSLYAPNSTQSFGGSFVMANAGVKSRLEVKSIQSFTQIHDGQQTWNSFQGVDIPPTSKFGLVAFQHFGESGFTVSALPDKNKMRAFSFSDAEGNTTNFYLDSKTGRIKSYEIPYNGYTFGADVDELKEYEGVLVPTKFVQRLDTPYGAFYAEFKTKEVKINTEVPASWFEIPTK